MSNYNLPEDLMDDENFKSLIKNIFTYKSADSDRDFFVKTFRDMLTGDQDTRNHSRDIMNEYLNKECDSYVKNEDDL